MVGPDGTRLRVRARKKHFENLPAKRGNALTRGESENPCSIAISVLSRRIKF